MNGHIHILGICGTFMGGIALLARELGFKVTGSDAHVYPPMSQQLQRAGIALSEGYQAEHLQPAPDIVIVGNALSRGNPAIEYMLNAGLPYTSGPQWLAENVLRGRNVIAVAGTHGKTTTSSLVAWLLESAGLAPGFLIGGVPANFNVSARLGESDYFVVEADEYDTAFFDKRSKFVHYRPRTLLINNLEFDHADIFDDLAAIQRQFHHLIRCVPGDGLIVHKAGVSAIDEVMRMGFWTPKVTFSVDSGTEASWRAEMIEKDGTRFRLQAGNAPLLEVNWTQIGTHNVENALAAIMAAQPAGVSPDVAAEALRNFSGVRRRLELLGTVEGISVFDDFAHHPTAIALTLEGVRNSSDDGRILAVIEPRSNTMRLGKHRAQLADATRVADKVYWYQPADMDWSLDDIAREGRAPAAVFNGVDELVNNLVRDSRRGDQIVIMSNGGFAGIHQKLLAKLRAVHT